MGSRKEPGVYDCHARAEDDEPTFTLLARDPLAPILVNYWARLRSFMVDLGIKPESDRSKVDEARVCAVEMSAWRRSRREEVFDIREIVATYRESAVTFYVPEGVRPKVPPGTAL